jgi:hypothetical protein
MVSRTLESYEEGKKDALNPCGGVLKGQSQYPTKAKVLHGNPCKVKRTHY